MSDAFVYVYKDIVDAVQYLPWGIITGGPVAGLVIAVISVINRKRGKEKWNWFPLLLLFIYGSIMIAITYLSRESGSRTGVVDMELFSTWGINSRNNAFVIENILLFIPYGFLIGWSFDWTKNVVGCVFLGFATSLLIEYMQLVTGRGYFQIDDILTNTLGAFIGSATISFLWLLKRIFKRLFSK